MKGAGWEWESLLGAPFCRAFLDNPHVFRRPAGLLIAIGALHNQRARSRATSLQQLTSTLGVPLAASVDDSENELSEIKTQVKMLLRKLNQNSEPQASIESGSFTIQYVYSSFYER